MKYAVLICAALLFPGEVLAQSAPNFSRGTMTSHTETFSNVTESIHVIDYTTGSSYTMTGTNVQWNGTPTVDTLYTQINPGEATQFSETYLGTGVASETFINRTTTIQSVTDSISVFTQ